MIRVSLNDEQSWIPEGTCGHEKKGGQAKKGSRSILRKCTFFFFSSVTVNPLRNGPHIAHSTITYTQIGIEKKWGERLKEDEIRVPEQIDLWGPNQLGRRRENPLSRF